MAWPYGGTHTHTQLAEKFGWPTVIISIALLPLLLLWSKLLAFPVWISYFWPSKPFYTIKNTIAYPKYEDAMRQKVYISGESSVKFPAGWNCHCDVEGGKFYESFWGIMQCMDLDANDTRFIVSPNFFNFVVISNVFLEFPEAPVYENKVRFYFPLKGPNMINPFCWVTLAFAITGITFFGKKSFVPFKDKYEVVTIKEMFPEDENPENILEDGSLIYKKMELLTVVLIRNKH